MNYEQHDKPKYVLNNYNYDVIFLLFLTDVNDGVNNDESDVLVGEGSVDGQVEGDHNDRVEGEAEDDPVPDYLEGGVVEQDMGRGLGWLVPVFGEGSHEVLTRTPRPSARGRGATGGSTATCNYKI